jgi:hypothetical protein
VHLPDCPLRARAHSGAGRSTAPQLDHPKLQNEGHELLLHTIVQIPLDLSAHLVCGRDDTSA